MVTDSSVYAGEAPQDVLAMIEQTYHLGESRKLISSLPNSVARQ